MIAEEIYESALRAREENVNNAYEYIIEKFKISAKSYGMLNYEISINDIKNHFGEVSIEKIIEKFNQNCFIAKKTKKGFLDIDIEYLSISLDTNGLQKLKSLEGSLSETEEQRGNLSLWNKIKEKI